jgi:hypothetical protein
MTPLLLTYCVLALPYLVATVRLALTVSVLTRPGVKLLP